MRTNKRKKLKSKKKLPLIFNKTYPILLMIATLFMGIAYATINGLSLNLKIDAIAQAQDYIYAESINYVSNNNAILEKSAIKSVVDTTLKGNISLSSEDPNSTITYNIVFYNSTDYDYYFTGIQYMKDSTTYSNENIIYNITNVTEGAILKSKDFINLNITFSYKDGVLPSSNELSFYLNFEFKRKYTIEYLGFNNTYPTELYENNTLTIDITQESVESLTVLMNNTKIDNYTYENGILTIPNVTGNLIISTKDVDEEIIGEKFNEAIFKNESTNINSSNGLYQYNSKYYYSGSNVNNYVEFNDEVWRIVSIEEDGSIKIVKDSVVEQTKIVQYELEEPFFSNYLSEYHKNKITTEGKIPFDIKGKRPLDTSLTNSYCINTNNGCHAYDKGTYNDQIVDDESIIKTYLEKVYYSNMTDKAKSQIQNHKFNIGVVVTNINVDSVISNEKTNTTTSNIGLLNVSDYIYSSLNTECKNSFDKETCANDNWLLLENYQYHLINGKKTTGNAQIWTISSTGKITSQDANNNFYLRPVVVLNKNITVTGTGNINDKYKLQKISE